MILSHRRWSIFLSLLFVALGAMSAAAQDKDSGQWKLTEEFWYTLELGDARAGWMHTSLYDNGSEFRTETVMKMAMKRGAMELEINMESSFTETHDGRPILMTSMQDMSVQKIDQAWRFKDDHVEFVSIQGGRENTKTLKWPEGDWLTPMGIDRFLTEQIEAGKSEIRYRMLTAEHGMKPVDVTMKYAGDDLFAHDNRMAPVTVWESTTSVMPVSATEMFDAEGNSVFSKMTLPIGTMVTKLASKATALGLNAQGEQIAELEAPEIMFDSFISPNRAIKDPMRATTATLRLRPKQGELPELPSAGAQRAQIDPDTGDVLLSIDIADNLPASGEDEANEAYLESTTMVDSNDTVVKKLAERAVRKAGDDPFDRAEAMRAYVNRFISKKGLATAFASASETARMRTGDCSEHGVLLAALLRADGIPSRVATGLVYVDEFIGQESIFGWHMWTQALIDGKWVDFDATLPVRYTAGHVLTATSALDEGGLGGEDMSSLFLLMGNLEIDVEDVGYEKSNSHDEPRQPRHNRDDEDGAESQPQRPAA